MEIPDEVIWKAFLLMTALAASSFARRIQHALSDPPKVALIFDMAQGGRRVKTIPRTGAGKSGCRLVWQRPISAQENLGVAHAVNKAAASDAGMIICVGFAFRIR